MIDLLSPDALTSTTRHMMLDGINKKCQNHKIEIQGILLHGSGILFQKPL